jgi:hypothetical protein
VDTAYKLVKREIAIQFRLRHKNIVFMLGCFHDKASHVLIVNQKVVSVLICPEELLPGAGLLWRRGHTETISEAETD